MSILNIDSSLRTSGNSSNFTMFIKSDLRIQRRFKLIDIVIPNTYYPVNNLNNKLYWQDSTNAFITSIIPVGSYTPSQLATVIGVVMSADSPGGNIITVTTNNIISKFNFATDTANLTFPPNNITTINKVIGINTDTLQQITTNANMPYIFNTSGCNEYYLRSNLQTSDLTHTANGRNDVLMTIPVTVNFGGLIIYESERLWYYQTNPKVINGLYFRLTDKHGNVIDLNGQDWTCSFYID